MLRWMEPWVCSRSQGQPSGWRRRQMVRTRASNPGCSPGAPARSRLCPSAAVATAERPVAGSVTGPEAMSARMRAARDRAMEAEPSALGCSRRSPKENPSPAHSSRRIWPTQPKGLPEAEAMAASARHRGDTTYTRAQEP